MVDFDRIEGFEWDLGNAGKSAQKHGITQGESEQIFVNSPLIVADDILHSETETRFNTLGKTDVGRLLHVTFTLRQGGKAIRVISARDMNRKERLRYGQST
ncbi:MAG TPA: BrnT family toxin [Rhizomicrobium sp.]